MQSDSESDDSRYDSAPSRPRKRGGGVTVVLTYIGLSLNLLTALVGVWGWANNISGFGLIPFVMVATPLAFLGLTLNVLAVVFGCVAAGSDVSPERKAAGRVCVVVALLQLLATLAVVVIGGASMSNRITPPVTKPTAAYTPVEEPPAVDERPTVRGPGDSAPTKQERGQ